MVTVRCTTTAATLVLASLLLTSASRAEPRRPAVDFNRDIRPILSDACLKCHGPDEANREADLRLDVKDDALSTAIVPGDRAKSEVFRRITAEGDERMPPADSQRKLSDREIALLGRWIDEGAAWQTHWSFVPPRRPPLPKLRDAAWPRNAIDHFILARRDHETFKPSVEADRETLVRRVTLDLTGLPPTPGEVDDFLQDSSPDAYEKLVDRLLASPRYGERKAIEWLDAARFADTSGYQTDGARIMWRWRDWVVAALNRNLPFDQFTIEQLAGDLLPSATLDQQIASGFNRNHRANSEGGIIDEEYLVEYAVDRVDTTSTVWLGLTLACARCHEHKYDPISQQEFYQVYAFFNQVPERGRVIKYGNSAPLIPAPTPRIERELDDLDRRMASARRELDALAPQLAAQQRQWEASLDSSTDDWTISRELAAHYALDGDLKNQAGDSGIGKFEDGEPAFTGGKIGSAASFNGRRFIDAGKAAEFSGTDKVSFGAWFRASETGQGTIVSVASDDSTKEGFSLHLKQGKLQVNLGPRWLDDAVRVETVQGLRPAEWRHVMMTYDGSQMAAGVKLYVDGRLEPAAVLRDTFTNSFKISDSPLRIGAQATAENRFQGEIDDVRFYRRELPADEVEVIACPESIVEIAAIDPEHRTAGQARKIAACFLSTQASGEIRQAHDRMTALGQEKRLLEERIPTVMVMQDRRDPQETFMLVRGAYDKPGEKVSAGVPACLPPLPADAPPNRLGFARWLVDPSHPLTSRVAVNRIWQMHFGTGLVKTAEDFGSQGERPSHPELLDWLAVEFVESGWDVKALERLVVTSATYRQSSKVDPAVLAHDPENRLLARASRLRLPAELIRDQALYAGGLLVGTIGGPSVKPYQPEGLWQELSDQVYTPDDGEDLYRRSMYTFWKRTVPPPLLTTFDATSRETCTLRRSRTNTPLQALALLNDVTYVEAARALAQRMLAEGGAAPKDRLALGFRLMTARRPAAEEMEILLAALDRNLARYREQKDDAAKLVSFGQTKPPESLDTGELAAYTAVAGLILNLDEAINRE